MTLIHVPDALRASVEAATGGQVTVLYDAHGLPSYMRIIPMFRYEDIALIGALGEDLGEGVVTAFDVNGRTAREIFVAQYESAIVPGATPRPVSLPGLAPATSSRADARAATAAKGLGWHIMTAHEWAMVALWCLAHDTHGAHRGNKFFGRSGLTANKHELGRRGGGPIPGWEMAPDGYTLTGSGPVAWRHDLTWAGIADLVGNRPCWVDGVKLVDGRLHATPTNTWAASEGFWDAQAVYFEAPGAGASTEEDLGPVTLASAVTNSTGEVAYSSAEWGELGTEVGYVESELARRLLIEPVPATSVLTGRLAVRNVGTRYLTRGSWLGATPGGWPSLDSGLVSGSFLGASTAGSRLAFIR